MANDKVTITLDRTAEIEVVGLADTTGLADDTDWNALYSGGHATP
ncbi:MAG: hypothetical protein ACRD0J_10170 [Acidimicrobiales bacterium]